MTASDELDRLEAIARVSRYGEGIYAHSVAHAFEIFSRFIEPGPILELGPAEGLMTDRLASLGEPLTVVDGGRLFCDAIAERHPGIEVVHSLFEDYRPAGAFRTIVLGHVLEHVVEPVDILKRAGSWLKDGGRILASVPNSRSLHRQIGVALGLIPFEEALNDLDRWHGHRRVYNPETFRRDFHEAGLRVELFGGYFLKPLSNAQLEAALDADLARAFMAMGERYPDIAGEIYIVARRK